MICDFRPFSSIFQSYKDDVIVIMKGNVQWKPRSRFERFPFQAGLEPEP